MGQRRHVKRRIEIKDRCDADKNNRLYSFGKNKMRDRKAFRGGKSL
jgi:hypothetical protein